MPALIHLCTLGICLLNTGQPIAWCIADTVTEESFLKTIHNRSLHTADIWEDIGNRTKREEFEQFKLPKAAAGSRYITRFVNIARARSVIIVAHA